MASLAAAGLVGRDHDFSLVEAALDRVIAGQGGLMWLEGEPGIGKSSLIAGLTTEAARAGCLVRSASGVELAEPFPLRLMADCLEISIDATMPAAVEIARLLRGERNAPTVIDPIAAAAERMLGIVDSLCAQAPLVLIAEDLHWVDQPSLGLWSRLSRSIDQIPLLLVGSCRPVPTRPTLQRMSLAVHDLGGTVLELRPLNDEDTVAAARHWLRAQPGPRLSAELARTGGNPLYIRELVNALSRDGSISITANEAELVGASGGLSENLAATIGRQLSFLSEPTRHALRLAAVLGPEFGAGELTNVLAQSAVQVAESAQEAIDGGVIAATEHGLRFRHDLIRQVLLEQTPAAVRQEISRQVARTLARAGHSADVVARQLLATAVLDEWAVTWLAQASQSLLQTAPEAYESLLQRALSAIKSDDTRWEPLASRLAQTHFWLGHDDDAERTAVAVLRRTNDGELAGRMSVQALRCAGRQNRHDVALAHAEHGLVDSRMPAHWQARLRAWASISHLVLGDSEKAKTAASEALHQARQCQDQVGIGYAYHALSFADPGQGRVLVESALGSVADDPDSADLRLILLTDHLRALIEDGAADRADSVVTEALVLGERLGTARAGLFPSLAADMHYTWGNWDEALRYAAMVPAQGPVGPFAQDIAAQITVRRGERASADAHVRAGGLRDGPRDAHFADVPADLTVALSLRAQADGDLQSAVALGKRLLEHPVPTAMNGYFGPHLVRAALELGDVATATAATAWVTTMTGVPEMAGSRLCQALIDDDADALLRLANEYRERGWRPYCAFALEEAAVRLGRAGSTEQARAALNESVQLYADLGATLDISRADARLRPHGIRRGPRSIRHRPTHGWASLTPRELRIAMLVAEGLSNPDIATKLYVSRATVQTHVSNILSKLGMRSRIELIRHHAEFASLLPPDAS